MAFAGSRKHPADGQVGNTYSYTTATWSDDIKLAVSADFDGFALNHGSSDWQFDQMDDAYSMADAQGSFKMFL
jgi:glucan endo-1,3-alpha-glucosidase